VPGRRVVSDATASLVTQMLEGVVREGTGTCAAVAGFDVAGKTGTSRKPLTTGGYSESAHMASFVGYAPAEAPRIAAIVVLDSPAKVYGGAVAAPVFSEIMAAALRSEHVVPPPASSEPPQWAVAAQLAAHQGMSCSVPHGAELTNQLNAEHTTATRAAKAAEAARKHAAYLRAHPHAKSKTHTHSTSTTPTSGTTSTTGGTPPGTGTVTSTTAPNG